MWVLRIPVSLITLLNFCVEERERQWAIGDEGLTAAALTFKMQPWQSKFDQI